MSTESLKKVIGRAVIDPSFRELLLRSPEQAAGDYSLSPSELDSLKGLSADKFDALASEFDKRISRAAVDLFFKYDIKGES